MLRSREAGMTTRENPRANSSDPRRKRLQRLEDVGGPVVDVPHAARDAKSDKGRWRMGKLRAMGVALALAALAGCQAPGVNLDSIEPHAVDVALRRAQLDSMCANVTPTVVDRQQETPSRATGGNVMLVYGIDVAGCGQRKGYEVKCPAVGGACFVATNRGE
jgi:hypothetical protein